MNKIDWIIIFLLVLLFHGYIFYPLSLRFAADLKRLFSKKSSSLPKDEEWPAVSMIIAAYNEEEILEQKIINSQELNYPKEKLEILIGSDGSRDRTADILRAHPEIRGVIFEKNRGKAAVLNDLISQASHEILLFCDANTMLLPNAIRELVHHFADPQVGSVSGRLLLQSVDDQVALSYGESLYWRIETTIKLLENEWGIVMGANGALYAIRKEYAASLPINRTVMDDFFITSSILMRGKKSLLIPTAIGLETTSTERTGEFRRKIRIGRANVNYLFRFLPLLNPFRPLIAYAFASHKLLRWLSSFLLLSLLLLSLYNALTTTLFSFSGAVVAAQLLFYSAAVVGWQADIKKKSLPICRLAYYFVSVNIALLIGFFQAFRPTDGGGWERVSRQEN